MLKKIKQNKKCLAAISVFVVLFLVLTGTFFAHVAHAADGSSGSFVGGVVSFAKGAAITFIGEVAGLVAKAIGALLSVLISAVMAIAKYNRYINETAVVAGWKQVRDLSNMFFILILLLIAFATILRVDGYSVKSMLPRVIIMAVLINFSKMICGLIIEMGQVVMFIFLNAINSNGSEYINLFGVQNFLTAAGSASWSEDLSFTNATVGYILAIVFLVVATVTMLAFVGVLLMRMVMLWIYIVLSPLAFLLSALPDGKKWSSKWWGDFTSYVVTGPILAFFLWLALYAAGSTGNFLDQDACFGPSKIVCTEYFLNFIIGIGMLIGGLMISSQVGGMVGSSAKTGLDRIQSGKKAVVTYAKDKTWSASKATGRVGLAGLGFADRLASRGITKMFGSPEGMKNFRDKGMVNWMSSAAVNAPGNVWSSMVSRMKKNDTNNEKRRNVLYNEGRDGTVSDGGKTYKANADGYYQELQNGAFVNNSFMTDSNNQRVKRMGAARAAAFDAWRGAQSGAEAVKNKAEEEKIAKLQKNFTNSNMSTEEMRRMFNDGTLAKEQRMALAMALASKGGFKNKKEIDQAKTIVQSNSLMSKQLNDDIDKNQAHKAYNFADIADQGKFKKRLDGGKIDSTKMDSSAYSNGEILKTLEDYHGKDFKRVLESAYKRGKEYEDNVAKGLLAKRGANLDDDASAKLHAKLTGKVDESFKDDSGNYSHTGLGKYVAGAKAKDLNNISKKDLETLFNNQDAFNEFMGNISYGKLKSMHKTGENPELVKLIKDRALDPSFTQNAALASGINNDLEIRTL